MSISEELTIHWMTDLHMKDRVTGKPDHPESIFAERHYYASVDKWRQAVDIANTEMPDLFICTGDIVDEKQDLASFLEHWDHIRSRKEFVPGNHDLDNGYLSIVRQLRYQDAAIIAGSYFNRSFSLVKARNRARVILLDTYVGQDGEHRLGSCLGTIEEDAFEWLEEEMRECSEPVILLFAHNGLGGPEEYFDQEHVNRFVEMTERLNAGSTQKRVYYFAGHHHVHPKAFVKEITSHLTFVTGVAMVVGERSYLNVLHLETTGSISLSYREVSYPYQSDK